MRNSLVQLRKKLLIGMIFLSMMGCGIKSNLVAAQNIKKVAQKKSTSKKGAAQKLTSGSAGMAISDLKKLIATVQDEKMKEVLNALVVVLWAVDAEVDNLYKGTGVKRLTPQEMKQALVAKKKPAKKPERKKVAKKAKKAIKAQKAPKRKRDIFSLPAAKMRKALKSRKIAVAKKMAAERMIAKDLKMRQAIRPAKKVAKKPEVPATKLPVPKTEQVIKVDIQEPKAKITEEIKKIEEGEGEEEAEEVVEGTLPEDSDLAS